MPIKREFIFLNSAGQRPPAWLRVLLTIVLLAAAVTLLWLGFFLALAVILVTALAILPLWAWKLFTASRRPQGPATIDGEYSVTTASHVEVRDETSARKSDGDA